MTTYTLRSASPAKTRADAVVVGVLAGDGGPELCAAGADVAAVYGRKLRPLLATMGVTGKAGDVARIPTNGVLGSPLLVLVGLGPARDGGPDATAVRRAAGVAARSVPNAASVALALPSETPSLVAAVTEGHLLGGYTFTRYKSSSEAAPAAGEVVVLSPVARQKEATAAFEAAQVVAAAVATTRDWVNMPPADFTPPAFADAVAAAHKELTKGRGAPKVGLEVLDEDQLAELGCGGILSVSRSSAAPARLVKLTWSPKAATRHLALVGKGITFDSGGLTIKPSSSMLEMKADMGGGAAVVQAVFAAARLDLPLRITAFVPMAENMISGSGPRPGDVVTMYGGTTVELANLDAEGRMLLADAMVMATEGEPDVLVDVATLTGHMQVALGDRVSAVMGTDEMVAEVLAAGERAGEAHWRMPIPEEMSERIRASKVADLLQHDWVRWGGGLYATAFLREFTGGLPWAHLDIAGKEMNSGAAYGHVPPGGTGFGVPTLVELIRALSLVE
ncbi:leucyl aminopeptidase [Nocardioides gansuensis]|uniref:Probable cytosol aminopeptidase n=1 Tax=Nocardioides gansuensis TaxID=2138300 RepID=A0A2T8F8K5_9ACTN|nr:leucyl aminopeptidase [Nocardioides gansuensis]PVG82029.1 leucyl aminopeptidase [Nocardioides gansuensis]